MFTGIITGIGQITQVTPKGRHAADGLQVSIKAPTRYLEDVSLGDSIAINGACMTVTDFSVSDSTFSVDISSESLDKTAGLSNLGPVNLEKALRANDRLGGHIVSGHVDGLGTVLGFDDVGDDWKDLRIQTPMSLARFFAVKGSVAVNGVSLTVNHVQDNAAGCTFTLRIIPHTLVQTTLGNLRLGDTLNLEIDTVARYVERMLHHDVQQRG